MSFDALRRVWDRLLLSRWSTWFLLLIYCAVVFAVLAPVLLSSVGADDRYWILEKGPAYHGSLWDAWRDPLAHAFDFDFQPRTTALAFSERQVLAVVTMKTATVLAIQPMLIWAAVKAMLILLSIFAIVVFLRQLTFRDRHGAIRGIDRSSIAFITIALPLTIAIGAKSQNVGNLNGWNYYPTLTYGPIVGYFLFAALVLKLSTLLQRNYRTWVVPAISLMVLSGIIINLSYEIIALDIPMAVALLVLQPAPDQPTRWGRWRAQATVMMALLIPYTVFLGWIRWRIANMACWATDSCYAGTVIKLKPSVIWHNFLGAFPGNNGAFVADQADAANRPFPSAGPASITLGILGAAALWALWSGWQRRESRPVVGQHTSTSDATGETDARGLVIVLLLALSIAVGTAVLTGMSAKAVASLGSSSITSYRTGPVTWSAVALAGVVIVRLLTLSRWRAVRIGAVAALAAVLIGAVGLYLPRNVLSAQENRREAHSQFVDQIHSEVALGDTSEAGDARRCESIKTEVDKRHGKIVHGAFSRSLAGAQTAFEFYHHRPYCSTFQAPLP